MKTLRILHLVTLFVLLFPVIVLAELVWLIVCIRLAYLVDTTRPIKDGIKLWIDFIEMGIQLNKEFVLHGI